MRSLQWYLKQFDVSLFARYLLRITIVKWLSDIVKDMPLVVRTLTPSPETNSSIKMEVGIEDCLHIEFEYNKCR
jgi:vacuolar protein sorting-associated protein 26